jgi:hypothetical protein
MIGFDVVVILLLTLRMALSGLTQPRQFHRKNNSSSLVGNRAQEKSFQSLMRKVIPIDFSILSPAISELCNYIFM